MLRPVEGVFADVRWPERRVLRIYAFDPMLGRTGELRVAVDVPFRPLDVKKASFADDRLEVVDYDAAAKVYYRAIDLDEATVAMQLGIEPSESDPQFHQQMVYAVAARVLENFDRALGRKLRFWGGRTLRLFPHAFRGRNAFFADKLNAVLFGYFTADEDDPGENLPFQLIFTCLSQDIIAHEVAHAALHRLHPHFNDPTSPQVIALHEAFADLVAVFQRFTYTDVVREVIRRTRGNLYDERDLLANIGAQFGAAAGMGGALRSLARTTTPAEFARTKEPHALGRILVEAVFDGFVKTYERRTADLKRIATGGSGRLPDGDLHPDLVARLANECSRTAQTVLAMCIRATDYLPPVDPTFSDFLRAMVTADYELNRSDELQLRASIIEAFRLRGIRPDAESLAVDSILLDRVEDSQPDKELGDIVRRLLNLGAFDMSRNKTQRHPIDQRPIREQALAIDAANVMADDTPDTEDADLLPDPDEDWRSIEILLLDWAEKHRDILQLDRDLVVRVAGYHPVHRVAPSGELVVEMVAQFVQTRRDGRDARAKRGGLPYRAGTTMVATLDGSIRYIIAKPFSARREKEMADWVETYDLQVGPAWPLGQDRNRLVEAFSARAVEGRKWR
jgi:hypothetical protein